MPITDSAFAQSRSNMYLYLSMLSCIIFRLKRPTPIIFFSELIHIWTMKMNTKLVPDIWLWITYREQIQWTNAMLKTDIHIHTNSYARTFMNNDAKRIEKRLVLEDMHTFYVIRQSWRTASSEFCTYRLCEQRRFRLACASAQSRQNLCCSLIQAVNQEEPSDRKPDPWPLWMAGHAQLKFVMTECSKTNSLDGAHV